MKEIKINRILKVVNGLKCMKGRKKKYTRRKEGPIRNK